MRQIIAMGGGGFLMEPHNPLLDKYILEQSKSKCPRVCFIGTASGDAQVFHDRFYKSFTKFNCIPTHLSLFKGHPADIEGHILSQNIIYVGGGNTRNMLALWREWELDKIIRQAYEKGIVLAGISAGSICWFEEGLTDSVPGSLTKLKCLGFLKGSNCPHYDGEQERRPSYQRLIESKNILPGIAMEDGVAGHYIDEKLNSVVSSRPNRFAFEVILQNESSVERSIPAQYLGGRDLLLRRAVEQDAPFIHVAHMKSIQEICSKDYSEEEIKAWGHREYKEDQRIGSIKNDSVWVIEDKGQIEGYGHFKVWEKDGEKKAHIYGLYLTPRVAGKSMGRYIVEEMIKMAREENAKQITLESTLTSFQFCKKMGFAETGPQISVEVRGYPIRCHPMKMVL